MRWIFICTTWMAIAAVISASQNDEPRPKRDITFIKNFLTTKLFGGQVQAPVTPNYRLFRIPGFDNILVKAIPKVNVAVQQAPLVVGHQIEEIHPSVALVSSYLGTKSPNETFAAFDGVKNLLESGVLSTHEEDNPYHVALDIPSEPVQVEAAERVQSDYNVPTPQDRVPIPYAHVIGKLYKPVKIPLPSLAYPTTYSYKQVNHDGVTTYKSNDSNTVVVSESKAPVHLPHYLSGRFQDILALSVHPVPLTPMPIVKPLPHNVQQHTYVPMRVGPAFISNNNYYNHLHHGGLVSTYSGEGVVKDPVPLHTLQPLSLLPFNPLSKVAMTYASVPQVTSTYVPSDYSYKHLHQDGSVSTYTGSGVRIEEPSVQHFYEPTKVLDSAHVMPIKVTPAIVPTDYSYKHLHNDGTMTSYSGASVVDERPNIVVQQVRRPIPLPSFFANRIENVAAAAIPIHQEAYPFIATRVTPVAVPNSYSYKHVHNDGSVTSYSGADVVQKFNENPDIAMEEVKRPILPPSYFIDRFGNVPAVPVEVISGHSYKHVHNDGTVTSYSDAGVVDKNYERPALVVEEARRPIPLPSFFAHRLENVAATAYKFSPQPVPLPIYGPPRPIYQEAYPVLLQHLSGSVPKPLSPYFNDEIKINFTEHNAHEPTGYSYQTVHQDGTSTVHFGSGLVQESSFASAGKNEEDTKESHQEGSSAMTPSSHKPIKITPNKDDESKFKPPQTGGFSYLTIHDDGSTTIQNTSGKLKNKNPLEPRRKPFKPTRSRRPISNVESGDSHQVLVPKPIVTSQYTYKQINHHLPIPFTVVPVGNVPKKEDIEKIQGEIDDATKLKDEINVSVTEDDIGVPVINSDYLYVPPETDSTPRPVVTGTKKGFSYNRAETASKKYEDNLVDNKQVYNTTEATVSSSAISLSANPIVVLPREQIFSYKQDRAGSSITVTADKNNKVSVTEENRKSFEPHRGDIPETLY